MAQINARNRFRRDLPHDARAGLTVAVVLIPQGLAYAMLAGLPPVVGLYAAIFPQLVYAALGTSRQLAVGPVAMDSLLVASALSALDLSSSAEYLAAAIVLAALVGLIQMLMGVLRVGFLVNFLSRPVISGFTSAAAILIGISQLGPLMGMSDVRGTRLHELLRAGWQAIPTIHGWTVTVGLGAATVLIGLKRFYPKFPGALLVVAVAAVVSQQLHLQEYGVRLIGVVPPGLPSPALTLLDAERVTSLLPAALTIALVGFMEAISVGKAFASKYGYDLNPNRELVSLGAANVGSYLFGGYVVSGGLSRTAVNADAGARTAMASVISAALVALSLWFLTPFIAFVPKAVLAAIVLLAVVTLIDTHAPRQLWRIKPADAVLAVATAVATLALGLQRGLAIGVAASLALFIYRTTRPHTAELGRLPGTHVYRNVLNFPEAQPVPGIRILRMDASFYFGNVAFFKEQVERLLRQDPPDIHSLLIDASSINDLDSSATQALQETAAKLQASGRQLYLANVKGPVRQVLSRAGPWSELAPDHIFLDVHTAVEAIQQNRRLEN